MEILNSLSQLLVKTLSFPAKVNERLDAKIGQCTDGMTSAANALLAGVEAITAATSLAIEDGSNSDSEAEQDPISPTFLQEANRRLPGPLVVLLSVAPTHQFSSVRNAAAGLCHAVLVDTRGAWRLQREDVEEAGLTQVATECCLSLLGDEDGEYIRGDCECAQHGGNACVHV